MKPCTVGQIPAKAEVVAQEDCTTGQLAPRLAEANSGQRVVFFMEAAPCVFAPFLGLGWCVERLFVQAPSGRQRFNGLAALHATTRDIFPVTPLTDLPSETVWALLPLLAGAQPGVPSTIVRDTARSQRCALGQSVAQRLGIAWLFLPPYAPNLHLMERCWQLVKKTCLYSKYSADSLAFQHAIIACIEQSSPTDRKEWESLLVLNFQTFKEVQVLGEASHICLFPVVKKAKRKVSSKAA